MANLSDINDLIELSKNLKEAEVLVVPNRCLAVKNRHSKCSKCIDACQVLAITVGNNKIELDNNLCMGCGACTTVCPTEALIPLSPTDLELARSVKKAKANAQGTVVIACARIASRGGVDPDAFTQVPCLARVYESLLVGLVAEGVQDVCLVDGNCKSCKYGACDKAIQATVDEANTLLEAQGCDTRIQRAKAFPAVVPVKDTSLSFSAERRAAFEQTGTSAISVLGQAAKFFVRNEKDKKSAAGIVLDRLGVDLESDVDLPAPHRHEDLINAMDALGETVVSQVVTRNFGIIEINEEKCTSCAICAKVCPTDALRMCTDSMPDGSKALLEMDVYQCIQCNMCQDACFRYCLKVSNAVSPDDLFNFDPLMVRRPSKAAREEGRPLYARY